MFYIFIQVIICDILGENEANISEKERLQRVHELENMDLDELGKLIFGFVWDYDCRYLTFEASNLIAIDVQGWS